MLALKFLLVFQLPDALSMASLLRLPSHISPHIDVHLSLPLPYHLIAPWHAYHYTV